MVTLDRKFLRQVYDFLLFCKDEKPVRTDQVRACFQRIARGVGLLIPDMRAIEYDKGRKQLWTIGDFEFDGWNDKETPINLAIDDLTQDEWMINWVIVALQSPNGGIYCHICFQIMIEGASLDLSGGAGDDTRTISWKILCIEWLDEELMLMDEGAVNISCQIDPYDISDSCTFSSFLTWLRHGSYCDDLTIVGRPKVEILAGQWDVQASMENETVYLTSPTDPMFFVEFKPSKAEDLIQLGRGTIPETGMCPADLPQFRRCDDDRFEISSSDGRFVCLLEIDV